MRGFYDFMMWFLSITTWKNIMGVICAKIWSMVMIFESIASTSEHTSQEEASSVRGQNLPYHEDLETLLSELTDIKSLNTEICAHSSHGQFIFQDLQGPDYRQLLQTEDQETYFAVLDHISSSMRINKLKMLLRMQDEEDPLTNAISHYDFSNSTSEHRQKELADYLEAFWKAVASNKSLESVDVSVGALYGGDHISGIVNTTNQKSPSGVGIANWSAKVLFENKTILKLKLTFNSALSTEAAHILSIALLANQALKTLKLSPSCYYPGEPLICGDAMKILLQPFSGIGDEYNNALEHLLLGHETDDNGVEHIAAMLTVNNSLKGLSFKNDGKKFKNGVSKIGDALFINRSLQELKLDWMTLQPDECKGLLKPLMQDDSGFQTNTSLKPLDLRGCKIGQVGFEYLIAMIDCNISLRELSVGQVDVLNGGHEENVCLLLDSLKGHRVGQIDVLNGGHEENVCLLLDSLKGHPVGQIDVLNGGHEENVCLLLDSLKGHPSIERLLLPYTWGVKGDKVLGTFMDFLLENNHLQKVDLFDTPLSDSGNAEKIYTELKWR